MDNMQQKVKAVAELGTELMRFDAGVSRANLGPDWQEWLSLQQRQAELLLKALQRQPSNDR